MCLQLSELLIKNLSLKPSKIFHKYHLETLDVFERKQFFLICFYVISWYVETCWVFFFQMLGLLLFVIFSVWKDHSFWDSPNVFDIQWGNTLPRETFAQIWVNFLFFVFCNYASNTSLLEEKLRQNYIKFTHLQTSPCANKYSKTKNLSLFSVLYLCTPLTMYHKHFSLSINLDSQFARFSNDFTVFILRKIQKTILKIVTCWLIHSCTVSSVTAGLI